jgi:ketosteroid isomerase-like protein
VTDEAAARQWMEAYLKAWTSNDRDDIGALFADDARLRYEPHTEWLAGRDAIVEDWLRRRDEPGDWEFEWDVLAVSGDLAFIEGRAAYSRPKPITYSNLWVVRLEPDGRASEFTEWWMDQAERS